MQSGVILESGLVRPDVPAADDMPAAALLIPESAVYLLTGWVDETRRICWARRSKRWPGQWECHRRGEPPDVCTESTVHAALDRLRRWGATTLRYAAEGQMPGKGAGDGA